MRQRQRADVGDVFGRVAGREADHDRPVPRERHDQQLIGRDRHPVRRHRIGGIGSRRERRGQGGRGWRNGGGLERGGEREERCDHPRNLPQHGPARNRLR